MDVAKSAEVYMLAPKVDAPCFFNFEYFYLLVFALHFLNKNSRENFLYVA